MSGLRSPIARLGITGALCAIPLFVLLLHCGSNADSLFTDGQDGGACPPDLIDHCGGTCAFDTDCAPGIHCSPSGICSAECSAASSCNDGLKCSPRGRCTVDGTDNVDGTFVNNNNKPPDYDSSTTTTIPSPDACASIDVT